MELNLCIAVTIDTPAHGKIRDLFNTIHLFNISMAGLAGQLAGAHMLGMTEKHMIRQLVHSFPLYRFLSYRARQIFY